MRFYILILVLLFLFIRSEAQLVEVQYNYNNIGDCIFGVQNQTKTPLFLNLKFTSIENTTFREPLPYVKLIDPGFNSLFTLQRESDTDAPNFIFDVKTFRSNPLADVNLDFPYLVPFAVGEKITPKEIQSIEGFWGDTEPKAWRATGFTATPSQPVYASRQGQIVEIAGPTRAGDSKLWYNTWTNSITLLQPDGTLITYKNVVDAGNALKLNDIVFPGQQLGVVAPIATDIILMVYHNSLSSSDLQFIIPQFVFAAGKTKIITGTQVIEVVHPEEVIGLEMTKKELKKFLSDKKEK